MNFIKTRDNTNLYYKEWGAGRPVILIHGWPLSSDSWDYQAMALADAGYRTIAYDRRGFGRSEQSWAGYDYDTLSDDLHDVIKATGSQEATIVGFSMGGGEVARYMSRHKGENVVQAVLISSVVPYMLKTDNNPNGVDESTFNTMAEGMNKDRGSFFSTFFQDFYGADENDVSQELLEWSRNVSMSASLKATLACADAFATTDFRPDLSSFDVPTLVVHGTADSTVPIDATGKVAAEGISNAILKVYEGAPHGLFATHKDKLRDDLLEFVNQPITVEA